MQESIAFRGTGRALVPNAVKLGPSKSEQLQIVLSEIPRRYLAVRRNGRLGYDTMAGRLEPDFGNWGCCGMRIKRP